MRNSMRWGRFEFGSNQISGLSSFKSAHVSLDVSECGEDEKNFKYFNSFNEPCHRCQQHFPCRTI